MVNICLVPGPEEWFPRLSPGGNVFKVRRSSMKFSQRMRWSVAFVALALTASLAQQSLRGEDPAAKPEAKPSAKERAKPRGRLPANYGKVVDPLQKEKIYGIQEQYEPKLEALRAQLKDLVAKRDAEIDALLTAEQREKVKELAEAAKARRAKAAAAAAAASSDGGASKPAGPSSDAGGSKGGVKTSDSSPKKSS
jgi:hypothetical protein